MPTWVGMPSQTPPTTRASHTEAATQTTPPPPPPSPPTRSYVEAATQATTPPLVCSWFTTTTTYHQGQGQGQSTERGNHPLPTAYYSTAEIAKGSTNPASKASTSPSTCSTDEDHRPTFLPNNIQARADAPMDPGGHQEGVTILGIRWLLQETRRTGKAASSLVIYLKEGININKGVRMGRRIFRTTQYDWER